jgi:hypothetical protein
MSAMTISPYHRESPMIIVPSDAGFAEIISPFWRERNIRTEMDWERRWRSDWDRRHVED